MQAMLGVPGGEETSVYYFGAMAEGTGDLQKSRSAPRRQSPCCFYFSKYGILMRAKIKKLAFNVSL